MDTPGPMLENEYALCGQALNHKNTIHRVWAYSESPAPSSAKPVPMLLIIIPRIRREYDAESKPIYFEM